MKIAVVGSREIYNISIGEHISPECDELISGGAKGVDTLVKKYAVENNIKITELMPKYNKYGRAAPIVRNKLIVDLSDEVVAFWNGKSRGTKWVIDYCKKTGKSCKVIICN